MSSEPTNAEKNWKHFKDEAARWYKSYVESQRVCQALEQEALNRFTGNKHLAKNWLENDLDYIAASGDRNRDAEMVQMNALMALVYKP